MSRKDNYPDDMIQSDSSPGSPFYRDPDEWIEHVANDVADEWTREFYKTGIISYNGYEGTDLAALMEQAGISDIEQIIWNLAYDEIKQCPEFFRPEPMPRDDYE